MLPFMFLKKRNDEFFSSRRKSTSEIQAVDEEAEEYIRNKYAGLDSMISKDRNKDMNLGYEFKTTLSDVL